MWSEEDDIIGELEAYVEGRLAPGDKALFEHRLSTDPELADQLARYRATREAIVQHHADEAVRGLLKDLEARGKGGDHPSEGRVRELMQDVERREHRRRTRWRLAWAAAVIALLGTTALWFHERNDLSRLANFLTVEEAPLPVYMSASDHRVVLDEAMQAYAMGDDPAALQRLSLLPPNDTVLFYTALVRMRSGGDATAPLDTILAHPASPYRSKALYHRMVLALRSNDAALAEQLWRTQMELAGHPYRDRLEDLAEATGWTP